MVIFGAGASFDSVPTFTDSKGMPVINHPWRLPVTKDLFSQRFQDVMAKYPRVLDVAAYLRGIATDVERELDDYREQSAREPERARLLAEVRYYLQDTIAQCQRGWENSAKGASNYRTLLTEINRHKDPGERACLVSFNWDTLLEAALPRVKVNIREINDYLLTNYLVIKPHGSANWGRLVETYFPETNRFDAIRAELIDALPNLEITDKFELVTGDPTGLSSRSMVPTMPPPFDVIMAKERQALFPALAIPVLKKYDFECPKTHQQALFDCLPKVDKLLIIGWRAAEEYFLGILRSGIPRDTKFMIVSSNPQSATSVVDSLLKAGVIDKKAESATGGFTAALASHEIERFLTV